MSRKRQKSRPDDDNGFAEWGGYMEAKKAKLSEQFDVITSNVTKKSNVFEGVSILVNGYTRPSADELKFLMAEHGGTYHLYPNQRGITTHVVATNLPNVKINQGNSVPVVNPKWITDSIEVGKLLDFKKYLLYTNESRTQPKLNFTKTTDKPINKHTDKHSDSTTKENQYSDNKTLRNSTEKPKYAKTANDPEFLSEFYSNSRLHLISTLGAEFKQLVNEFREKNTGYFPGLLRLVEDRKNRKINLNRKKMSDSDEITSNYDEMSDFDKITSNYDERTSSDKKTSTFDRITSNYKKTSDFDKITSNDKNVSNFDRITSNSKKTTDFNEKTTDYDQITSNNKNTSNFDRITSNYTKTPNFDEITSNFQNITSNDGKMASNDKKPTDFDKITSNYITSDCDKITSNDKKTSNFHKITSNGSKITSNDKKASDFDKITSNYIKTSDYDKVTSNYGKVTSNYKQTSDFDRLTSNSDKITSNFNKITSNQTKLSSKSKHSVIMHIDMDCFFVSVGLRSRPHLKGKPIAVTHSKTGQLANRNVDIQKEINLRLEKHPNVSMPKLQNLDNKSSMAEIASCSYEARKCGIRNGMLMGAALKLCPDLVPIPYDFEGYKEVSRILYDTIAEYTVDIEAVSCDEMYVDVTKILEESECTIEDFAAHIRNDITSRTGCPCSTGFASNRLQARMATKKAKPNGWYHLRSEDVEEYFREILLEDLPGVGWSTLSKLQNLGLKTCGDIQKVSMDVLKSELGQKTSQLVYEHSLGIDNKPLSFEHERKSVSVDVNYGIRFKSHEESLKFLQSLSKEVYSRLTDCKMRSKCVTLKLLIRAKDAPIVSKKLPKETAKYLGCGVCDALSRSTTTNYYITSEEAVFKEAKNLYSKLKIVPEDLRGVGLQLSRLEKFTAIENTVLKNFLNKDNVNTTKKENIKIESDKSKDKLKLGKKSTSNNLTDYYKTGKRETTVAKQINNKKKIDIDLEVLKELPEDIRKEILLEYNIETEEISNRNARDVKENVEGKINVEKLNDKPVVKSHKKGFSDLSEDKLRMLLKNWMKTESNPNRIDVEMLGNFLKSLAENREIEKLYPLVKFIYRHVNDLTCNWHEAYFQLIQKLQEGMLNIYGNQLFVQKKFNCNNKHS